MPVTFDLPQDIDQSLRQEIQNLEQAAKEATLVELYRQRKLTHLELARALGLTRLELESLLRLTT